MDAGDLLVLAAICLVAGGVSLLFGVGVGLICLGLLLMVVVGVVNMIRIRQK